MKKLVTPLLGTRVLINLKISERSIHGHPGVDPTVDNVGFMK